MNNNHPYFEWEFEPNQKKTLEYYTGIEAGNPSGSVENVKYIKYEKLPIGESEWFTVLTQLVEYNGDDCVTSITPIKN